ncbi:SITS-binding protein [Varanus komodoensis]|nr:SITS-binding protein [Varanus komodoensis]
MNKTWKGAVACLGVAVFFVMTIGIIYWQVVDQPNKNWILKGRASGLFWERKAHSLILQTLSEEKTLLVINMGSFPDVEVPFVKNLCSLNKSEFCYTWEAMADLKISLEASRASTTECYYFNWTPLHCQVKLKVKKIREVDCFSMENVSWYGGPSVSHQFWPLNHVSTKSQPFIISNLSQTPDGYGSVLERYFLGSTGVTVMSASDIPLSLSIERDHQFCLESTPGADMAFLQYTVCASKGIISAHLEVGSQFSGQPRKLPDSGLLRLTVWRYYGEADSAAKMERGLRAFFSRLQTHRLGEGLIMLSEHSTMLLHHTEHTYLPLLRRKRLHTVKLAMDYSLIKPLKLAITLSPYASISSQLFQRSLQEGKEDFWLSHHSEPGDYAVPLLSRWRGQLSARLNVTSQAAVLWYMDQVNFLKQRLGAEYVIFEGGEGNLFLEHAIPPPTELKEDNYICILALIAVTLGNSSVISAGTRASHLPLFLQMSPRQSDWSYAGLKGIIPSALHYSLLGYNFFIPDAIGGTLATGVLSDEELYVRWLQIVAFLPVMSFSTPPWVCCDDWVLNLTRHYIEWHQNFVVPLIEKYSKEWLSQGYPIFRPLWWLCPTNPIAFAIDDEFLIGDEVLVAPITERGQRQRDIYLPREGQKWMDTSTARVYNGGTFVKNYSVALADVPVFIRTS